MINMIWRRAAVAMGAAVATTAAALHLNTTNNNNGDDFRHPHLSRASLLSLCFNVLLQTYFIFVRFT